MISTQVDWTRKDFRSFLNAMERRGRDEVDVIARETSNETGKTEEEVRRYHTVFWARHKELADWERVIDKIEKGEKRLQRSKEIREALAEKIARSPKPHECLPLNYGASRGKVWTEEEDAFLLNMMHTYGYGNWERIRVEIRNAWQFNFDWFFKSRNASELGRRADLLIKLVEKENSDLDGRSRPKSSPRASVTASEKPKKSRSRKRSAPTTEDADAKRMKAVESPASMEA